jgi:hypothetical protein
VAGYPSDGRKRYGSVVLPLHIVTYSYTDSKRLLIFPNITVCRVAHLKFFSLCV